MSIVEKVKIKIEESNITNVNLVPEKMRDMNAYKVTLIYKRKQLTTPFYTGRGWTRLPNQKDVLYSLIMDSFSADNARNFEDFCSEFGYEPRIVDDYTGMYKQNKEAKAIYEACCKTSRKLRVLLGDDFEAVANELQDY